MIVDTNIVRDETIKPAPEDIRSMAVQAEWPTMYAMHRWASVIIHPGFGNFRPYEVMERGGVVRLLYWACGGLVLSAAAVAAELDPAIERPDLVMSSCVSANGGEPWPREGDDSGLSGD